MVGKMKKILLALFLVCFTGALSAQMKIVLEKDVDKINSAAKQNKQTEATNKRTFSEDEFEMEANNVKEKKSQGDYANNKPRTYNKPGKKKSYSDIQNERQRRRKENKLSDIEEIQAQLKELEKVE